MKSEEESEKSYVIDGDYWLFVKGEIFLWKI